jgi:hypothetical protein
MRTSTPSSSVPIAQGENAPPAVEVDEFVDIGSEGVEAGGSGCTCTEGVEVAGSGEIVIFPPVKALGSLAAIALQSGMA